MSVYLKVYTQALTGTCCFCNRAAAITCQIFHLVVCTTGRCVISVYDERQQPRFRVEISRLYRQRLGSIARRRIRSSVCISVDETEHLEFVDVRMTTSPSWSRFLFVVSGLSLWTDFASGGPTGAPVSVV